MPSVSLAEIRGQAIEDAAAHGHWRNRSARRRDRAVLQVSWRRPDRLAAVDQPARIALARAEGLARLGADKA